MHSAKGNRHRQAGLLLAVTIGLWSTLAASDLRAQQNLQRAANTFQGELSAESLATSSEQLVILADTATALERRQSDLERIDEEITLIEHFIETWEPPVTVVWLTVTPEGVVGTVEPDPRVVATGGSGTGVPGLDAVAAATMGLPPGVPAGVPPDHPEVLMAVTQWQQAWATGIPAGDGGGGDCFCEGTLVTMADGERKEIEAVAVGEEVLGRDGVVNTVVATPTFPVGRRTLYIINDILRLTPEHPLLTEEGWKSIDPQSTRRISPHLPVARLDVGDMLVRQSGTEPVLDVSELPGCGSDVVYSLMVSGDGTYIADGYVVHHNFRTGGAHLAARAAGQE